MPLFFSKKKKLSDAEKQNLEEKVREARREIASQNTVQNHQKSSSDFSPRNSKS